MDIKIELDRKLDADFQSEQVSVVLQDVQASFRQFPKLKKLTQKKADCFQVELKTIGSSIARVSHDVCFGAECHFDEAQSALSWKPIKSVGNAAINGTLQFDQSGKCLDLSVRGVLHGVPVPLMYRLVAPAFIQGKFSALCDAWLERLVTQIHTRSES